MTAPSTQPTRRLHTYRQAGDVLGISDRTVWTLVKTGRLKAVRFGGTVRISDEALEEFIRLHEGEAHVEPH